MGKPDRETEHVFTVSDLTRGIKILLEAKYPSIWLEGEVSNYRASPAGTATSRSRMSSRRSAP